MRILIVTYKYAPFLDPRAFRWTTIAEHWASHGHEVDVVTAWKLGMQKAEFLNGVHVRRVGGTVIETVRELVMSRSGPVSEDGDGNRKRKWSQWGFASSWVQALSKLLGWIWWPDYAWSWYLPAVRMSKRLLRSRGYDGMITVSIPFTGHLVGHSMKKSFPDLRWLIDIGDPFSFMAEVPQNNDRVFGKLNAIWEGKVMESADVATVTTAGTRMRYSELFPRAHSKIHVIPPLLSPVRFGNAEGKVFHGENKIRLVFVGTLYKHLRNPEFLLRVFDELMQTPLRDRLELHFLGAINDCREYFIRFDHLIGDKLYIHGMVPRETVFQAMKDADVLVNIGNYTSYQLPSKVVEYASSGKPVLNLHRVENDSSIAFYEGYPSVLHISEKEPLNPQVTGKILDFLGNAVPVPEDYLEKWLANYKVEKISSDYLNLISND